MHKQDIIAALPTQPAAREFPTDPLTLNDIVMERVRFEERRRMRHITPTPVPAYTPRAPFSVRSRAALHAFSSGITHESLRFIKI